MTAAAPARLTPQPLHMVHMEDTGGKSCQDKAGERAAAGTKPNKENASWTGVKLLLREIMSDYRSKVPRSRLCEFKVVVFHRDSCSHCKKIQLLQIVLINTGFSMRSRGLQFFKGNSNETGWWLCKTFQQDCSTHTHHHWEKTKKRQKLGGGGRGGPGRVWGGGEMERFIRMASLAEQKRCLVKLTEWANALLDDSLVITAALWSTGFFFFFFSVERSDTSRAVFILLTCEGNSAERHASCLQWFYLTTDLSCLCCTCENLSSN